MKYLSIPSIIWSSVVLLSLLSVSIFATGQDTEMSYGSRSDNNGKVRSVANRQLDSTRRRRSPNDEDQAVNSDIGSEERELARNELRALARTNGTLFLLEEDSAAEAMNTTTYYSTPSIVIPLSRVVTTNIIALVESLKSFNGTERIPIKEGVEFFARAIGLMARLPTEDGGSLMRERPAGLGPNDLELRCYRSEEIGALTELRDFIAESRAETAELIRGANDKISRENGTNYDCTDLMAHLRRSVENNNGTVVLAKEEIFDSTNIFVCMCTEQMRMDSVEDLVKCMDAQIEKGENVITTEADFYITAFDSLNFFIGAANMLSHRVMGFNQFSYGDPLAGDE